MMILDYLYPGDRTALFVANILIQVSFFCGLALVLSRRLRNTSAIHYWILCSALVLSLLCPVSLFCIQIRDLNFLSIHAANKPLTAVMSSQDKDRSTREVPQPALTREHQPMRGQLPPSQPTANFNPSDNAPDANAIQASPIFPDTSPNSSLSWLQRTISALIFIWVAGSVVLTIRFLRGYRLLHGIRRSAVPITAGRELVQLESACRSLAVGRIPQLLVSNKVSSPFVSGFWRPAIIWPHVVPEQTTTKQLKHILLHEVAHVARRDHVMLPLQHLFSCLFWFHPLATMLDRRISQTREKVCDMRVLQFDDAISYSKTLFHMANSDRRGDWIACGFGFQTSHWKLQDRIGDVLAHSSARIEVVGVKNSLVIVSFAFCLQWMAPLISVSIADGQENAIDVENLTLEQVTAGLRKNEERIKSLRVEYLIKSEFNFTKPGEKIPAGLIEDDAVSSARTGKVYWHVNREGIGRTESRHSRVNTRFDGSQIHKRDRFVSAFDGLFGYHISSRFVDGEVRFDGPIRKTDHFTRTAPSPFDFTTKLLGESVSRLPVSAFQLIGYETWEGRSVVVLEVVPDQGRDDYALKHHIWIDPNLDFTIVRRLTFEQRGEKNPWALHLRSDSRKLVERAANIWLPDVVENWNFVTSKKGQGHMVGHDYLKTSNWIVNQPVAKEHLKVDASDLQRIGDFPSHSNDQEVTPKVRDANVPDGFRNMTVRTVDDKGQPVKDVRIYVAIWPMKPYEKSKENYFTADDGKCVVLMPDPPRLVRLWTQKPGYVPMFTQWWPKRHPEDKNIPKEFEFELPTGTKIGGVVEDENGQPIQNAIVEVMVSDHKSTDSQRARVSTWLAEVPGPGENPCITDRNGRWSLDNVPAGKQTKVRIKLTHPNYVSDSGWGVSQERQGVEMEDFRRRKSKLVMRRGKTIKGRVTTSDGKPVANALVVCGKDPYLQEGNQEVRTNAAGEYTTMPLNVASMEVTVVAAGWSPELKTVSLDGEKPKADFQLQKGTAIRLRFIDRNGRPIPNVAVGVNRWRGLQSLYNHIHPNVLPSGIPVEANDQGIFEWNWAPRDEVKFWFFANGFETVHLGIVARDELQTIMMNPQKPEIREGR